MTEINDQVKINLGYSCNNNCSFCYEKGNRYLPDKTTSEIIEEILVAKKKGKKSLRFIGGEPTIRPDIIKLISYAKGIGFNNILLTTNGRMFAYLEFARRMIDAGMTEAFFSIHGHRKEIHDTLTKTKDCFSQLMQGIKNMKKLGFERIGTNIVITKKNYLYLPEIADILSLYGIRTAEFIYVYTKEVKKFKNLIPLVSEAAPYILQVLGKGNLLSFHWRLLNPPMGCYFKEYINSNVCYCDSRNVINFIKAERCNGCSLKKKCSGVWQDYMKQFGDSEVKLVT